MLEIKIEGKPITINRGTSIQVELNNSIFSTDGIEGDVAYSFDVPAKPNDSIFDSARFVYIQRRRKYECDMLMAGVSIGKGYLYVTKASDESYSCELSVNAFPDGWRDRKMSDNYYGDDIVISNDYDLHKSGWLKFLSDCVAEGSNIKFPMFIDESYYQSNEDFGMLGGKPNMPVGFKRDFQRTSKFVNRLIYQIIGGVRTVSKYPKFANPGESLQELSSRFEIFNEPVTIESKVENNQVSFAPAISVAFMLSSIFKDAGYDVTGNLFENDDFTKLFFQSLCSMDSTMKDEYIQGDSYVKCSLHEPISSVHTVTRDILPLQINSGDEDEDGIFDSANHTYEIEQDGIHHFIVSIKFRADITRFAPNCAGAIIVKKYGSSPIPSQVDFVKDDDDVYAPLSTYGYDHAELCPFSYGEESHFKHVCKLDSTDQEDYEGYSEGIFILNAEFTKSFTTADIGKKLTFSFTIGQYILNDGSATLMNRNDLKCDASFVVYAEGVNEGNIFKSRFVYGEYMPTITNSEFINTLKNMFGIGVFIDSTTKKVELSLAKDIIASQSVIDLTKYNLPDETAIERNDAKNYTYELQPVSRISGTPTRIENVEYMSQLPIARKNIGKCALVRHLNEIYMAEKIEDDKIVWNNTWNRSGGNDSVLEVHSTDDDNEDSVNPGCSIPSVDFIDSKPPYYAQYFIGPNDVSKHSITVADRDTEEKIHFPDINGEAVSFINGNVSPDTNIPLILLRYIGDRELHFTTNYNTYEEAYIVRNWAYETFIQKFSPVCYDDDNARVSGNDLTATGDKSIGEVYVKPWLELLSDYEKITYRFILSPAKILEVMKLFRPQDVSPEDQVRWIYVENVKLMPIRMTFEVVEGKETILAEIECAKPVVRIQIPL